MLANLNHGEMKEFSWEACLEVALSKKFLTWVSIPRTTQGKYGQVIETAILLNVRSQKCSSIQKLLGVLLRASGCDKDILNK